MLRQCISLLFESSLPFHQGLFVDFHFLSFQGAGGEKKVELSFPACRWRCCHMPHTPREKTSFGNSICCKDQKSQLMMTYNITCIVNSKTKICSLRVGQQNSIIFLRILCGFFLPFYPLVLAVGFLSS